MYGEKIKAKTNDEILSGLRLNYLGFVFQTFNLISSLTAKQNVELPMILKVMEILIKGLTFSHSDFSKS